MSDVTREEVDAKLGRIKSELTVEIEIKHLWEEVKRLREDARSTFYFTIGTIVTVGVALASLILRH